ncbi:hypothetical protein E2C01_028731 [Portunus trituberculatus]|uniref:Uncharacterized protein n=1 Tax=Portunus trituberculatus TaxID=210409 RepID=A0A5B7EQ97_PORTR|nr:hypothetical protein [Portunus trituberculatus]
MKEKGGRGSVMDAQDLETILLVWELYAEILEEEDGLPGTLPIHWDEARDSRKGRAVHLVNGYGGVVRNYQKLSNHRTHDQTWDQKEKVGMGAACGSLNHSDMGH